MRRWPVVPLGEIVKIVGGGTPSRNRGEYFGGGIPWVTPKDMKTWEIVGAQETLTRAGVTNSATRLVPPNSVLVVVRSGVLKHTLPVAINRVEVAINQDMKALLCDGKVVPDYLARFVKASSGRILATVRATTADNFPIDVLRALLVPLPPLAEQRHIAEVLHRAAALRAKRSEGLRRIEELKQSILQELLASDRGKQTGWVSACLGDLVSEFRYGTSNKSETRGSPVLRIPNVVGGAVSFANLKQVPLSAAEFERLRLLDGDLLFVRSNGNPEYVGRCAVFDARAAVGAGHSPDGFVFASYLIRARVRPNAVSPVFLREWLLGPGGRKQLRAGAKTSAGQFNINTESLGAISIRLPPGKLQAEFDRRMRSVESLSATCASALVHLERLCRSLEARAFSGRL